ncbi:MAG: hypothetical protein ACREJC_20830 [Tepidisphaeraceae bacterium]
MRSNRKSRTAFCAATAIGASMLGARALATTYTWNGGGGNVNWSTGTNWVGGSAATSADTTDLVFQGTTNTGTSGTPLNQNITSGFLFNSMTFASGASAFFIGGSSFAMGGSADGTVRTITQSSSNTVSITNNFGHAGGNNSRVLTLAGTGTGVVTLSGIISESTGGRQVGVAKNGSTSTFILSGANT